MPENEKKLKTSIQLNWQMVELGLQTLEKFPTGNYGHDGFIFINFLERFTFHLESVSHLLTTFASHTRSDSAIGLILRASLLDFMMLTYLSTYMANNKSPDSKVGNEEFDRQVQILLSDQVFNTLKYLKLVKEAGLITDEEYKKAIDGCVHTYGHLFSSSTPDYAMPEKKMICQELVSPRQLFTRINAHPLTKKFALVYDTYTYYSKYEHFGIMTHFLQRIDHNEQLKSIIDAIKYIYKGFGATLAFLNSRDGMLNEELSTHNSIAEEFEKL